MPDVVALSDSFVPSLPKGWNAAVRIKLADGTTDATVYKDANGDATGANPLPLASAEFGRNYDGNGGWQCYLVPGDYVVSVTPHGGSEHHASVTVTAAAAGVTRALYEVYGTPSADVPVPTWNPDSGRLEFAAGGGGGGGASEQSAVSMESDGTFDGAFVGGWSIDIDSGSSGVSVDADDHSLINVPAGVYTANVLGEISGWADATSVYAVVTGVDSRYGDSGNATAPAPITDGGGQITGSVGWFHMAAPGQIQVKLFVTGSAGEATDYVGFDLLRLGPPFGA